MPDDTRDIVFEQTVQRLEEAMEENARLVAKIEQLESAQAPPEIQFTRLDHRQPAPARMTPSAAGWDLMVTRDVGIWPGEHKILPLGVKMAIPDGYAGQLWPRSGLAAGYGIDRLAGLIDPDYRGEAKAVLINHGPHRIEISAGERVCQLVVVPCLQTMVEVDSLDDTDRGEAGFGSTDRVA